MFFMRLSANNILVLAQYKCHVIVDLVVVEVVVVVVVVVVVIR